MKKTSTAMPKRSRNISQQKLTIGLDLGDRNSWYCVVDEVGQIQREQRVRTTVKGLQEVFSGMPRSRIALEIGTHSPWISRLLSELGHEVMAWPRFHSQRAEPQGAKQMAAPAELRTPNMHRGKRFAPRECGWKHGDSGERLKEKPKKRNEIRFYLTPTGLLMEGHCTQIPTSFDSVRILEQGRKTTGVLTRNKPGLHETIYEIASEYAQFCFPATTRKSISPTTLRDGASCMSRSEAPTLPHKTRAGWGTRMVLHLKCRSSPCSLGGPKGSAPTRTTRLGDEFPVRM